MSSYDLAIIGAGPAGLTAGLYGARSGLKTVMFEGETVGGQIVLTEEVENYPGFVDVQTGPDLAEAMLKQAQKHGAELIQDNIIDLELEGKTKTLKSQTNTYTAKAVIIATGLGVGATPEKLNVPGEERYTGKGVSYCAVCDCAFFKGKTVAVVGGGDLAVEEAVFLTKFASKVYLIHDEGELQANDVNKLKAAEKLDVILNTSVQEVNGDIKVASLTLLNKTTGESSNLQLDGVFVYIGVKADSSMFNNLNIDQQGFIITNEDMETGIPGVYAAGDNRKKIFRQLVTACADGAIAAYMAEKYIEGL